VLWAPRDERAELERLVGEQVVRVERAEWGFTNRTDVVTLTAGRRVVLQRYASRSGAVHRLRITAALTQPMAAVGVPTPRLIRGDVDATPPYAVFEELHGVPGQVAAGPDLSAPVFDAIASQMGTLVRRVAAVPADRLQLPRLWAEPDRLSVRATGWLAQVAPLLDANEQGIVRTTISALPGLFAGRAGVLAHGDFGATNVLVADGRLTGLLDWEFARLADPLFDIAWWAWLLRFHTPAAYARTWPLFAAAARVDADEVTGRRIETLQLLRVLEATVHFSDRGAETRAGWLRRLSQTLAWPRHPGG